MQIHHGPRRVADALGKLSQEFGRVFDHASRNETR
jgi:hypothetical protein